VSEQEHTGVPPAGEQIHMPAPSILPLINAAGLALAIVSITLNWVLVAAGAIIFIVTAIKWIGDTRTEISHLPLEHGDDQH
jgi:hypothetical protein